MAEKEKPTIVENINDELTATKTVSLNGKKQVLCRACLKSYSNKPGSNCYSEKHKNNYQKGLDFIRNHRRVYYEKHREKRLAHQRELRKTDKYKERMRDYHLRKKYNLDILFFEERRRIQNNKCAICEKEFIDTHKIYVDHNHKTGKFRGLLCPNCNTLLGRLELVGEEGLKRAQLYLDWHKNTIEVHS
jgi:hypothetical protein